MTIPLPFISDIPLEQVGYLAVFIVLLLDGANIPFTPIELFLGLTGYLVAVGEMNFAAALGVTVAGNITGHVIIYTLGYMVGRPFFDRYGKYLFMTKDRIAVAEQYVAQIGPASAIAFRVLPGLRAFASVLMGTMRMHFGTFLLFSTIGVAAWNVIFLTIGFYFGVTFAREAAWIVPIVIAVLAAGLCLAAIGWYAQMKKKKREQKNT